MMSIEKWQAREKSNKGSFLGILLCARMKYCHCKYYKNNFFFVIRKKVSYKITKKKIADQKKKMEIKECLIT